MANLQIKKGDMVYVLSGKSRGKKGKVLTVEPADRKVIVEGVNMITKHVKPKPNQGFKEDGIIHQEAPIYVDKVMLICKNCGKPTKVGKKLLDNGTKARVCKKCGEVIDIIGEGKE
ncbi:MAG TPA: 50S ribosomal protein L24 [Ruminiclostridium sp.]|jgi:large subunit ribosomal protein L24|nr:50S ribosomal protein L24 [Ruminiclostridium sp.]